MRVVGVDVSDREWVGIVLVDGRLERGLAAQRLDELVRAAGDVAAVGVDIPLGSVAGGRRACDAEARARLGTRGSSVFPAPPRGALAEGSYEAANAWTRAHCGRGLSRQSYGLGARIADAEASWVPRPDLVFEMHPEVSFRAMADGVTADGAGNRLARKRSWAGHRQRLALLSSVGIEIPDELGDAGRAGIDDVLDAAAVAWSAHRIVTGVAVCIPEVPERDEDHGHPVAIWY